MKHPHETGHFQSDIAADVVDEAVKAVEQREGAPNRSELELVKTELELSLSKGRELMAKLAEEHEKLLRAIADLENFKKRAAKEKEEVQKYGNERVLLDFLPVLDNFDRALESVASVADFESFKSGVDMIRRLFVDALSKHGVKSFSAKGQAFDPTRHEAMSSIETVECPPQHVHSEVLRGFTLNDRLVRPALVVVARAPATAGEGGAPAGGAVDKVQAK